jgi:hypothetical protein
MVARKSEQSPIHTSLSMSLHLKGLHNIWSYIRCIIKLASFLEQPPRHDLPPRLLRRCSHQYRRNPWCGSAIGGGYDCGPDLENNLALTK